MQRIVKIQCYPQAVTQILFEFCYSKSIFFFIVFLQLTKAKRMLVIFNNLLRNFRMN